MTKTNKNDKTPNKFTKTVTTENRKYKNKIEFKILTKTITVY